MRHPVIYLTCVFIESNMPVQLDEAPSVSDILRFSQSLDDWTLAQAVSN